MLFYVSFLICLGWLGWVGRWTIIFVHAFVVRMVARFLNKPRVMYRMMYNNPGACSPPPRCFLYKHLGDSFGLKLHTELLGV